VQVGSFARALFLVHSECLESNYVASRPFRVNAVRASGQTSKTSAELCLMSILNPLVAVAEYKAAQSLNSRLGWSRFYSLCIEVKCSKQLQLFEVKAGNGCV
jgi:hypothetical protein